MRKFLVPVVVVCFLFSGATVFADSNIATKKKASSKNQPAVDAEAEKRKAEEERRTELNNSEWVVTIVQKGGDYAKDGEKDKLVFRDGKMSFKSFEGKGYAPAGYSLVVNPNLEGGTWETYIAGKEEARLSVRGDWRGNVMNGTIVEQEDEKTSQTYYFSSQEKKSLPPVETKQEAESAALVVPGPLKALISKDTAEKRY